jgi:hypothetical protein
MFRYLLLLSGLFTMLHAQVVQDEWIDPSVLEDDEVFRFKSIRSGDTSILSHIGSCYTSCKQPKITGIPFTDILSHRLTPF